MREIYLDNSATTKVRDEVIDLMVRIMREDYGNAASLHLKGVEAERYVKRAKEQLAAVLKVDPKTVYFTSGGTESNNWALRGAAYANRRRGMHIVTTSVEHTSVKNVLEDLKAEGFEITYLPVDENGLVRLSDLEEAVRPDTILVSVMFVNNEIGALEPIGEIGAYLHAHHPDVLFHTDAIQAFGKLRIQPKKLYVDLLSCSGHKLHGPKGVGFLYVSERTKIRPILFGGGQQKGLRSGTENVPGEAGLGLAAELADRDLDEKLDRLYAVKARLVEGLQALEGAHINGKTGRESAPQIVSCTFSGVRSEVLLHSLEERGIYVSSGSACSSSHPSLINTLAGIGLSAKEQEGTIRFSLNEETSEEDIDETLQALRELLPVLRRFVRR